MTGGFGSEDHGREGPRDGGPTGRRPRPSMAHPAPSVEGPSSRPRATEPRPILERLGMAAVALVLGLLFAAVAAAAYVGGELFLAVMAGIGSLMTLWVGALTLLRG